jgi:hypothetical protein
MSMLEHILNDVRNRIQPLPGEDVERWAIRTYRLAIEIYDREKPPLESVEATKQRSDALLKVVGKPER